MKVVRSIRNNNININNTFYKLFVLYKSNQDECFLVLDVFYKFVVLCGLL